MGRIKAKRLDRDRTKGRVLPPVQHQRRAEGDRYSSVGESLTNGDFQTFPYSVRSTVSLLISTYMEMQKHDPNGEAACGGPLLVHLDGSFECHAGCPGATKVIHVPEALQYCDRADEFVDELFHTCAGCSGLKAAAGAMPEQYRVCAGTEIDHSDGETTCTLGDGCLGADQLHASGQTCGLLAPCERCGITSPLLG
ncbi:hypothetical protein ACTVZO_45270 [Streptomyces sp. IBSNAI002]|uniref:hypothetical protein n=1 Tax=Streptomyces sp. IBSNAI002 TaxID=3457500 RepID=UPI003FD27BFB